MIFRQAYVEEKVETSIESDYTDVSDGYSISLIFNVEALAGLRNPQWGTSSFCANMSTIYVPAALRG